MIPGPLLGPKKLREFALRIRAELDRRPEATLPELMKATGASQNVVVKVRSKWRAERAGR